MGGRFTGQVVLPETVSCTSMQKRTTMVSRSSSTSSDAKTPFSATLSIDLNSVGFDPKTVKDTQMRVYGYAPFLMSLEVNNALPQNNNDGSSWNSMNVQWATIPWYGSWSAEVTKTVIDSTTGHVFAVGITADGDVGAEEPNSQTGWIGKFDESKGSTL